MRIQGLVISGIIVLFLMGTGYGIDRYVPSTSYTTIQSAIDASSSGDRVILYNGLFEGAGNRDITFAGKDITVQSVDPSDPCDVVATIINVEGTDTDPHRGFIFENGETNNAVLDGITIRKGYEIYGGGIYCTNNSNPIIKRCVIHSNEANYSYFGNGGGICCDNGAYPRIEDCAIQNNTSFQSGGGIYIGSGSGATIHKCVIELNHSLESSTGGGGGIYCLSADCQITSCTISNNESDYKGGGIYSYSSDLFIQKCTIEENKAYHSGGGMYFETDDANDITVTQCTITDNVAETVYGGGIGINLCSPDIQECIISGNSAGQGGGGIYSGPDNTGTIDHCIIAGNKAADFGGGIYCYDSQNDITFCTFTGNLALSTRGGGFCSFKSTTRIVHSILWGDSAPVAGELAVTNAANPSTLTVLYCDVQGGLASAYSEAGCVINWPMGNIDHDPNFVDPGSWDDNSTPSDPSDDVWIEGDHHLKSNGWRWDAATEDWTYDAVTSRCIDAGNPGTSLGDEPLNVPPDPTNIFGENIRINMGVYGGTVEASMPPYYWTLLGDLSNNGIVSLSDQTGLTLNWLNTDTELPGDLNRNGTVDINDLNLLVTGWLETTSWF